MENTKSGSISEDEAIKKGMEKIAPTYDRYMKMITLGRERILRERTVEAAGVKPGDSVLEVGCGTGSLTLAAKRKAGPAGKAAGIDIIPVMIELSRQKAARAGETISFQLGSIDKIPFPDHQFDVVMGSFMIFHMSDETRRKGLTEILRVLKPGGRLLFMDLALPTQPVQRFLTVKMMGFSLEHELEELRSLMADCGFMDVELGNLNFNILGLSFLGTIAGTAR